MTKQRSSGNLKRRDFLTLCGVSSIAGLLAACQGSASVLGSVTPTPKLPTPTPSPTRPLVLTSADWKALAHKLQGSIVLPQDPRYNTARQLFDPRFDAAHPAAIAYCASPADLQTCLAFAHRFNIPVAPRSGGHSYAGYSTTTGLVLDVTRMNKVSVDTNTGHATIGSGTRLIDVYSALAQYGLVIPAGSCPTVGVAGLTMGGGVGVIGRKFGLTCDNLLSAQVVLADGRTLTCDTNHNADLFWALRGGGGGNFGIVTSFTFQAHTVPALTLFTLNWAWSSAVDVFDAWQHWAPQAPDELWSNCLFLATSDKNAGPIVRVNGVYVGGVTQLTPLLQQLTSQINTAPIGRYVGGASILDTMLYEAGCYGKTVGECHLPSQDPSGQMQRGVEAAKSDYFTRLLPRPAINILVKAIADRQASSVLGEGGIGIDAYGGAINRVAADATAFAHRNALCSAQYNASWNATDSQAVIAANHSWLANTWQAMRPYASGAAYQNYVDPDLNNWQAAYYGSNLARLKQVKATYDPENFFHFGQSIPLR